MERNYTGHHNGNSHGNMISSGRRAGTVRSASEEEGTSNGYGSHYGMDSVQQGHMPRFGRRASPGSTSITGGMEMDPPGYRPSAASGASAGRAVSVVTPPSAGSAGGGASSKLSGLQRLKEASTARLVSRIPSANGRSGSAGDAGGYVPSAMTQQQPTRSIPGRNNSGGATGYSGSSSAGYGSSTGVRSASTGPSMAAAGRPPSGRSNGSSSAGYGSTAATAPHGTSRPTAPSAAALGGGYGRSSGSAGMDYGSGSRSRGAPAGGQPAAARGGRPAATPLPEAAPPPMAMPRPSHHQNHQQHQHQHAAAPMSGGGGGGFFGGGGGGFGPGSVPPGAEDAAAAGPMVECPTCGRSFNQLAYSKHAKVCEKVFATKRKPVNMAAKRLEGSEAVKFFDLRKGVPKSEAKAAAAPAAGGRGAAAGRGGPSLDERPLPGSKVPKWKAQSEQLRAAMSANRRIADAKAKGMDLKNIKFDAGPALPDDRVQCPHCGRKFAELTAERHIPKCRDIMAKPGRLAAGGGRGAHMRR